MKSNHLRKKRILIQLSDGSSMNLICFIEKKEFLTESDIRSNPYWKSSSNGSENSNILKNKSLTSLKKLFNKSK